MNVSENSLRIGWGWTIGQDNDEVSESGRIRGVEGEYFREKRIYPPSSYFVSFGRLNKTVAEALQYDVDIISSLPTLEELPPNITTGPSYFGENCYLMKPKLIKSPHSIGKFQDSLETVEFTAGTLICIFTLALILLVIIFSKKFSMNSLGKIEDYFPLSGENTVPLSSVMSIKSILLILLTWIFLVKTVYRGFISTGLIDIRESEDIESFEDLLRKDIFLDSNRVGSDSCSEWLDSMLMNSEEMNRTYQSIKKKGIVVFGLLGSEFRQMDNVAFLISEKFSYTFAILRCIHHKEDPSSYHVSKAITYLLLSIFHRRSLEKQKKEILYKWAYSLREFGFASLSRLHTRNAAKKMLSKLTKRRLDFSCSEKSPVMIPFHQLQITFFAECFWLFLSLIVISILIFSIEMCYNSSRIRFPSAHSP